MEGNELNEMNSKFEYNEKSEGLWEPPAFAGVQNLIFHTRSVRWVPLAYLAAPDSNRM